MPRAWSRLTVVVCLLAVACSEPAPVDTETEAVQEVEPAAATASAATVRFAVIGDYGTVDVHELHVAQLVQGWAADAAGLDFVITMGDNNYNSLSTTNYEQAVCKNGNDLYYGQFVNTSADPDQTYCTASENVFFPTPGNHDWDSTHHYSKYTEFFPGLGTWDPDNKEYLQYTFGWPADGPVVQLYSLNVNCSDADSGGSNTNDGNHGCPKILSGDCATQYSDQVAWLKAQTKASTAPWNLVYFHQPPYSYAGNEQDCRPIATAFDFTGGHYSNAAGQPLSAVLSGHSHVYERIVMNEPSNMPFLIVGSSGKLTNCNSKTPPSKVQSAICHDSHHGAALVTASATSMTFEYYYNDGSLKDSCTWTYAGGSAPPTLSCTHY